MLSLGKLAESLIRKIYVDIPPNQKSETMLSFSSFRGGILYSREHSAPLP